jgi:hypothetical protein
LAISIACRGVTVLFQPFDLGFELLRLGHVLASLVTLCSVSYLLMLRPVLEARRADVLMRKYAAVPMPALGGYPVKVVSLPYQKQSSFQKGKPPLPPAATKALGGTVLSNDTKDNSSGEGDVEVGTGLQSSSASARNGGPDPGWKAAGGMASLVPPPLISNPLIAASLQPPRVQGPAGAQQQGAQLGAPASPTVAGPILLVPPPPPPAPQPPPPAPPPAAFLETGSTLYNTATAGEPAGEATTVAPETGICPWMQSRTLHPTSGSGNSGRAVGPGTEVLEACQQQGIVGLSREQPLARYCEQVTSATYLDHQSVASSQPLASCSHSSTGQQRGLELPPGAAISIHRPHR